jgi:transposase
MPLSDVAPSGERLSSPALSRRDLILLDLGNGGEPAEIASRHGLTRSRINQIARDAGIGRRRELSEAKIALIKRLLQTEAATVADVARGAEVSVYHVKKVRSDLGLPDRSRRASGPDLLVRERAVQLHVNDGLSFAVAGDKVGISRNTVAGLVWRYHRRVTAA